VLSGAVAHRGNANGGRRRLGAHARIGGGGFYSCAQGGEGCFLACQGNQVTVWAAAWPEYDTRGRRRAGVRPGYGGDGVGRSARVGFAWLVSVRRVAMEDWARTSVRGLGTSGHSGVPAFVPGRRRGRRGPASQRGLKIRVTLFKHDFSHFSN
jgi:hypothetical protein